MTNYRTSLFFKTLSALVALSTALLTLPVEAADLPAGYESVAGSSSYEVSGNTGTLTAGDSVTIGQWHEGFNIGEGFTFNAILPGNGVHLSRDITANPSQIFGALNVPQGKFFLVNRNGIFFSPTSQVNAAGLVASTLDISNQDFLNGRYNFYQSGTPASVVNAGRMNIGPNGLALLGGAVANTGVIQAQESSVAMASGEQMTLSFDGSGLINVAVDKGVQQQIVDADGNTVKDGVLNTGIVRADGGRVLMTAEATNNIFDKLVNQRGLVEARSTVNRSGEVELSSRQSSGIVENAGKIDVSAAAGSGLKGGKATVTGEKTGVLSGAVIDASGDLGGGTVLIGGDYQGLGTTRNADYTLIAPDAVIKADAITEGDGGKVIVWSDKATQVYGQISAKGGALSGDGGFVETSGKEYLYVDVPVDASAANGQAGTWLLDPRNLEVTAATNNNIDVTGTNPITYEPDGGSNAQVAATTLVTALNAGTSVILNTVGAPGSGDGNIIVNAAITKSAGVAATLQILAAGDIDINQAISGSSGFSLSVDLQAGDDVFLDAAITTFGGSFSSTGDTFDAGSNGDITTAGGNITITHTNDVILDGTLDSGAGSITVSNTGSNDIDVSAAVTSTTGDISFSAGDDLTVSQGITSTSGNVSLEANDNVQLSGANADVTTGGSFNVNADANANGSGDFEQTNIGSAVSAAGGITVRAADFDFDGTLDSGAADTTFVTSRTADEIGVGDSTRDANLSDAELDRVSTTGTVKIGEASNTGGIFIGTSEALTQGAKNFAFTTGGATTLQTNSFTTTGDVSSISDSIAINSNLNADDVTLRANDNTDVIGVGSGAGAYSLTDAELDRVAATGVVTIGDGANTGGINVDTLSHSNALKFLTGGDITLSNALSTTAKAVQFAGNVVLGTNATVDTTSGNPAGADVTFDGTVNAQTAGSQSLGVAAGTAGNILFSGTVGLAQALSSLTTSAATNSLKAVTTTGSQSYTGATTLDGNLLSTNAGSISVAGATTLGSDVLIQTAGTLPSDDITLGGTVTGANNLSLQAGSGDVSVTGAANVTTLTANANTISTKGVTTTGSQSYSGATTLDGTYATTTAGAFNVTGDTTVGGATTVTTAGAASDDINLNGSVTGANSLGLDAGSGDVAITGSTSTASLSATGNTISTKGVTTTGSQSYTGATTLDGAYSTTTAGSFTVTGATTLGGNTTVTTAGLAATDDITLNGTVTGAKTLGLSAGAGDIAATGAINATSLTASANTISTKGVTTTGSQSYTGATSLDGAYQTTSAGSFTVTGDTTLTGDTTVTTAGAASDDITFTGKIDGDGVLDRSLSLNAGAGDITVADAIGSANPLASLIATATTVALKAVKTVGAQTYTATTTTFGGDVEATGAGADITVNGDAVLADVDGNSASVDEVTFTTNDGDVNFNGKVDGTQNFKQSLTVDNGTGATSFGDSIGSNVPLNTLTLNGTGTQTLPGTINVQNLALANLNLAVDTILNLGTGTITLTNVDTNANDLTIIADEINFIGAAGSVLGGGTLTLQAFTLGMDLVIAAAADAGTLDFLVSELDAIADGFTAVLFKTSGGNGDITINAYAAFKDPISFISNVTGAINVNGDIAGSTADASITIVGSGATTNLAADITTMGAAILINDSVNLLANVLLDTTVGGGNADITITGAVNGPQTLTLTAGTGNTDLQANVGTGAALAGLDVTSATTARFGGNVTTTGSQSVTASTIQTNGTHSVTGATNTIDLTGNVELQSDTALNTVNGDVTVTGAINGSSALSVNAGTATSDLQGIVGGTTALDALTVANAGGTARFGGNVTTTGNQSVTASTIQTNGTHAATGAGNTIGLTGSVELQNDTTLSTNNGNVTVTGDVDGAQDLTVNAGSGDASITGTVGATNALDQLAVTAANASFGNTVRANNVSSTGSTTFTNNVTALTDDVTVNGNLTLAGDVVVTTGGAAGDDFSVTGNVDGAQDLTVSAGSGDASVGGNVGATNALDQLDVTAANVSFGGTVRANNVASTGNTTLTGNVTALTDDVTVTGDVTLAGDVAVTSGGGAGDDITVTGTIDGAQDLTLNSGSGDILLGGAVGLGVRLANFLIQNVHNFTANGSIFANSITQSAATAGGTSIFHGDLNTDGAAGISLTGENFTIGDNAADFVTTTNGGPLTIDNSGLLILNSTLSLSGAFSQIGSGAVTLSTDVVTNDADITFNGDVTITGHRIFDAGTATILFGAGSSLTDGASSFDVTLTADEINLLGGAGSFTANGNLLLQSSTPGLDVNVAGALDVVGVLDLTETDLNALADGFALITIGRSNGEGIVNFRNTSGTFEFEDAVVIQSPVAGGELRILGDLVSNQSTATITLIGSHATTYLNADIITAGADILINDTVIVQTNVTIDTTDGGAVGTGADIRITDAVEGQTVGGQSLTLNAGTAGDILLDGSLGAAIRLGALVFEAANNLTASDLRATSISTGAGVIGGTANFNGLLNTNGAGGIDLDGNVFNFNDAVTTSNNGGFTLTNSGLATIVSDFTLDGAFLQDGAGNVVTSGDITTTADDIQFDGDVTLSGNVQLSTGLGIGDIVFNGTVDSDATARNLTLVAGAGDIEFNDAVGGSADIDALVITSAEDVTAVSSIDARTITQAAGTGVSSFQALTTTGPTGIDLNGTHFDLNGVVTTTGGGSLFVTNSGLLNIDNNLVLDGAFVQDGLGATLLDGNITTTGDLVSFLSPVVLAAANATITTAGGHVNFQSTVNGSGDGTNGLTVAAGAGNVVFSAALGLEIGKRLANLTVTSANNVTANADIKAGSITQAAGTGTTTFNGKLDTNGVSGIALVGTNFTLNDSVTTTGTGSFTVDHAGLLSIGSNADMSLGGNFVETSTAGTGTVQTAGDVVTAGGLIEFNRAVQLTGNVLLSSAGGNIHFDSTVDGTTAGIEDLTLVAGSGNILMDLAAGAAKRLGDLVIQSAFDVNTADVTAASIQQVSGTGTTTFGGVVNTNSAAGIDLTGSNFTFVDDVTTTNNGALNVTNSGTLRINNNQTLTLDGAFLQDGTGASEVSGVIRTTGDTVTFSQGVNLTGDLSIDTTASGSVPAGAAVTFVKTLDDDGVGATESDLDVKAGISAVTFGGNVGTSNAIGSGTGSALVVTTLGQTTFEGQLNTANGITISNDAVFRGDVNLGEGDDTASFLNGNVTLDGLTFNSANDVNFGTDSLDTILLSGGDVTINSDTGATHGQLDFNGKVEGPRDLTVDSGNATTNFNSTLGDSSAIGDGTGAAITIHTAGTTNFNDTVEGRSGIQATHDTGTVVFNGDVTLTNGDTGSAFNGNVTFNGIDYSAFDGLTFGSGAADSVTLTGGPVTVNSNSSDLTFNGEVDGAQDLTLTAGNGDVAFNASVGTNTRIGDLTVVSADDVTFDNRVRAASITQAAGTGTTTFRRRADTDTAAGFNLTGTNFTFGDGAGNDVYETTNGGTVTINNSGLLTINKNNGGARAFDLDGAFAQTGSGGVQIGDAIRTTGDAVSFNGDVTLTDRVRINTTNGSPAGGAVTFNGKVDGNEDLVLEAGASAMTFNGNVGSTAALGDGTGAAITIDDSTGTATFNGTVQTNSGIVANDTGSNVVFKQDVTVTGGDTNSTFNGNVTLDGLTFLTDGDVTFGDLATDAITLSGGAVVVDATLGGGDGTITFNGTVDGGQNLTVAAGNTAGVITFNAAIGSLNPIGALAIQSALNFTAAADIFAASISHSTSNTAGTSLYNGNITTSGAAGINVLQSFDITFGTAPHAQTVTANNGGPFCVNHDGTFTLNADVILNGGGGFCDMGPGPSIISGNITTLGGAIEFFAAILLTADETIFSSGGGNIIFHSTIDGDGSDATDEDLTLDAGTGSVSFLDAIGSDALGALSAPRLGVITIQNALDVITTALTDITAAAIVQQAGTGTTTFNGTLDLDNNVAGNALDLTGTNFIFNDTVNVSGGGNVDVAGTALTFNAPVNVTDGGDVTLTNSGLLTTAAAGDFTLTKGVAATSGDFLQNGTGTASIAGDVLTEGGTITWNDPTLVGDVLMDTTLGGAFPAGAAISFFDLIDGTFDLTLDAGTGGNILFDQAIGSVTALADLIIRNANDVTANGLINANSITQQDGQGTTTLNGAVSTTGDNGSGNGFDFTGNALTVNNTITTQNGNVEITNAGLLTIAAAGDMNIDGTFIQNGAGSVQTAGDIQTQDGLISFATDVTLTGNVAMSSVNATGANISFGSTIDGPFNLQLNAGTGDIEFNDAIGSNARVGDLLIQNANNVTAASSIEASSIRQQAGTGTTDFAGFLDANGALGIDVNTNSINFHDNADATAGNLSANAADQITLDGGANLYASGNVNLDAANLIDLQGTVGNGINGPVGGDIRIGQNRPTGDLNADILRANGNIIARGDDMIFNNQVLADEDLTGGERIEITADAQATSRIELNELFRTQGGNVDLFANDDILFQADAADILSNSGNVQVIADRDGDNLGALTMSYGGADRSEISSGSGTIRLSAGEDVTLGGLITSNATANAVKVISTDGRILDGGETLGFDIDARDGRVNLSARNGIGNGANGALEIWTSELEATTFDGDLNVDLNDPLLGGSGPVTVFNASVTGGDGNITIRQLADALLTVVNSFTANGSINLSSIADLMTTGTIDANGPLGEVNLTADADSSGAGNLTVATGSLVTSSNDVNLQGVNLYLLGTVIANQVVTGFANVDIFLGLVSGQIFNLTAGRNIVDANGDAQNLSGGETSFLQAGGFIGHFFDPIEFALGSGDLQVTAGGLSDNVSVSLRGSMPGILVVANLTPGLVLMNEIARAGEPISRLDSGLAQVFNLVSLERPRVYMGEERNTVQGLFRGIGLVPGLERPFVPAVSAGPFEEQAPVVVTEASARPWRQILRPAAAPIPAPVVRPTPAPVVPPVVPAPTPVVEALPKLPTVVTAAPQPVTPPTTPVVRPAPVTTPAPLRVATAGTEAPVIRPVGQPEVFPPVAGAPAPPLVPQKPAQPRVTTAGPQTLAQPTIVAQPPVLPQPTGLRLGQQSLEEERPAKAEPTPQASWVDRAKSWLKGRIQGDRLQTPQPPVTGARLLQRDIEEEALPEKSPDQQ